MNNHQDAYRRAWMEYRDCTDEARKEELERDMDEAQNFFTNEEFHAFKTTLPGFVKHWQGLKENALKQINQETKVGH